MRKVICSALLALVCVLPSVASSDFGRDHGRKYGTKKRGLDYGIYNCAVSPLVVTAGADDVATIGVGYDLDTNVSAGASCTVTQTSGSGACTISASGVCSGGATSCDLHVDCDQADAYDIELNCTNQCGPRYDVVTLTFS